MAPPTLNAPRGILPPPNATTSNDSLLDFGVAAMSPGSSPGAVGGSSSSTASADATQASTEKLSEEEDQPKPKNMFKRKRSVLEKLLRGQRQEERGGSASSTSSSSGASAAPSDPASAMEDATPLLYASAGRIKGRLEDLYREAGVLESMLANREMDLPYKGMDVRQPAVMSEAGDAVRQPAKGGSRGGQQRGGGYGRRRKV